MSKRDYPLIPCADCGRPAKKANKQTRRCSSCRIARAVAWHDGREAQCRCGQSYIAWEGARSNPRCGACFITASPAGGRESVVGDCAYCHEHGVVYSDRIAVCWPCLTDPKNADSVKASVARKYERLRRKHEG